MKLHLVKNEMKIFSTFEICSFDVRGSLSIRFQFFTVSIYESDKNLFLKSYFHTETNTFLIRRFHRDFFFSFEMFDRVWFG